MNREEVGLVKHRGRVEYRCFIVQLRREFERLRLGEELFHSGNK